MKPSGSMAHHVRAPKGEYVGTCGNQPEPRSAQARALVELIERVRERATVPAQTIAASPISRPAGTARPSLDSASQSRVAEHQSETEELEQGSSGLSILFEEFLCQIRATYSRAVLFFPC